jgi:protein-L-isoaspartate O-methyltransferase
MNAEATVPRAATLARMVAAVHPRERDAFVDELLRTPPLPRPAARALRADDELIDCIPSGIAGVAAALLAAEVGPDDVFVDVGSGLGTVAVLAHLLTGARAIGVEIQPRLVEAARARAAALGLDLGPGVGPGVGVGGVSFVHADAREELAEGSVYYLYTPFVGDSMARAHARLHEIARSREIAICCLGFELARAPWLRVVDDDSIFLTVHETTVPGARRRTRSSAPLDHLRPLALRDGAEDP